MTSANDYLKNFPELKFSILPTPVQKLEKVSDKFKASIYCMRDDLTGFAFGGNKTRKLDFLIADAKNRGFDTLIGVGANQSNFCRMTAAAAKVAGLEVHLLLSGSKPEKPTANLMLDYMFGAIVHHTSAFENSEVEKESEQLEKELFKSGKKVYRMPMGGSTPLGALGYFKAFGEIMDFCERKQTEFHKIFLASGSGGTQAGLVLGQMYYNWPGQLIGISVGRSKSELENVIDNIVQGACDLIDVPYNQNQVVVDESFIGDGYGIPTIEGNLAIEEFANLEGILLDRVYTGKAAAAMLEFTKTGKTGKDENILFIHTGGNIELFE